MHLALVIIVGMSLVTPVFVFATYVSSGTTKGKGIIRDMTFVVIGSILVSDWLSDLPTTRIIGQSK